MLYGTSKEQLWYNPEEWPEEGVLDTEMETVPTDVEITKEELGTRASPQQIISIGPGDNDKVTPEII